MTMTTIGRKKTTTTTKFEVKNEHVKAMPMSGRGNNLSVQVYVSITKKDTIQSCIGFPFSILDAFLLLHNTSNSNAKQNSIRRPLTVLTTITTRKILFTYVMATASTLDSDFPTWSDSGSSQRHVSSLGRLRVISAEQDMLKRNSTVAADAVAAYAASRSEMQSTDVSTASTKDAVPLHAPPMPVVAAAAVVASVTVATDDFLPPSGSDTSPYSVILEQALTDKVALELLRDQMMWHRVQNCQSLDALCMAGADMLLNDEDDDAIVPPPEWY